MSSRGPGRSFAGDDFQLKARHGSQNGIAIVSASIYKAYTSFPSLLIRSARCSCAYLRGPRVHTLDAPSKALLEKHADSIFTTSAL